MRGGPSPGRVNEVPEVTEGGGVHRGAAQVTTREGWGEV